MAQRLSNYQFSLQFDSKEERYQKFYNRFISSNLGKIYSAVPWNKLVQTFNLKNNKKGPKSLFSPRGKIALMFLKHYFQFTDRLMAESIMGSPDFQFFCDLVLKEEDLINFKMISEIRCELAEKLDIDKLQKVLMDYWSPYIENKQIVLMDATCYESEVRNPTNQKLLFESIEFAHKNMKKIFKGLKKNFQEQIMEN